jgi:antitoxin component YwqK of YwqJK toxin-antitoxin module
MKTLIFASVLNFLIFSCSDKPKIEYDNDGRILRIVNKKENKETRISYYSNGNKNDSIEYVNGVMHGIKKVWHENGKQYYQASYRNGENQGTFIEWANGKDIIWQSNRNNGKPHGKQQAWFETGEKKSEENYIEGILNGKKYAWFKNGSIKGYGEFVNGTGRYIEKFENGDTALLEEYKDGKIHGTYKTWYNNGKRQEIINYVDGKNHGIWQKWDVIGKLIHESSWLNGNRHGKYCNWYQDGKINEESYWKDGKRNGISRKYYPTGELFKEGNYKDNSGKFNEFYKNKKTRLTGEYLSGKKHGRWKGLSEGGNIIFSCSYENDKIKEQIKWAGELFPKKSIVIKASGYMPDSIARKDVDAITEATSVGGNTYVFTDCLQFEFAYYNIKAEILDYYEKGGINTSIDNEIGLIVFTAPVYSSRFPQQLYDLLPGIANLIKSNNIPTTTLASCRFFDSGSYACAQFEKELEGMGITVINGIACVHEYEDKEWEFKIMEFVERLIEKSRLQ